MNRFVLSLFAVLATITVTAAETPSQINVDVRPIEQPKYEPHRANKFWTYSQCPYLLNGGIRTYTASKETCEADCNNHQECTAFHHYHNPLGVGRCELKKCPIPAPDPSGSADGWIGYSLTSDCKVLSAELNNFGTSPVTAMERKELLLVKIRSCNVVQAEVPVKRFAKRITEKWIANVNYLQDGQVAMSALQKTKVPHSLTQSPPAYLQFDSVASIPERPNQIFLSLVHNTSSEPPSYLGDVIITLDGDLFYPRLGKQMLELSTGNNRKQGSWRGAGFTDVYNYNASAEYIFCDAYKGPHGEMHSDPLFPVEEKGVQGATDIVPGQVRVWRDQQRSSWWIVTKGSTTEKWTDPIIGHVTKGLDIIQKAIAISKQYATDVTFTNAGLVIIDKDQ